MISDLRQNNEPLKTQGWQTKPKTQQLILQKHHVNEIDNLTFNMYWTIKWQSLKSINTLYFLAFFLFHICSWYWVI